MPKKKTHSEFIEELKIIDPNIQVIDKYMNNHTSIRVKCLKCGREWRPTPHDLLQGKGCKYCKIKEFSDKRRKPHIEFIKELSVINPNVDVLEEYKGRHIKIDVKCKICGLIWKSTPGDLLDGCGCRKCSIKKRSEKNKMSHLDFVSRVSDLNPNVEVLSMYNGVNQTVDTKCNKCGNIWKPKAVSLLQGRGCPICALKNKSDKQRKTTEKYVAELFNIHPNLTVLSEYLGDSYPIKVRCNVCDYIWEPQAGSLLRSWGCKRCSKSGTSYIEQCIFIALSKVIGGDMVLSRDCSAIGMELDIYIPDLRFAVEPGSWTFHKNSLSRDLVKRQKCAELGIELITVYYDFPKDFCSPFNDNCILFVNDSPCSINNLIYSIFDIMKIKCDFTEQEWEDIKKEAKENSMGKNTEKFKEELMAISPELTVLGIYQGSKIPILMKCNCCGKTWSIRPNNLLAGQKCPDCSIKYLALKQTKSHEKFCKELSIKQPNIEVLGTYEKSKIPLLLRCKVCGKQWKATPNSLLNGEGCPDCGLIKKAKKRMKTREEFELELFQANPDFQLISEYEGTTKQVKLKCKKCGYTWTRVARKILENPIHKHMNELHSNASDQY